MRLCRPGLAAVGGLVEAALAAALPQRAGRGHVDHVGIARVHHDAGDVLGELEADVAEGAAAVFALVDAVAVGDAALVVVLAGAHPDDGGILGIDGDPADGIGAVVVEDRGPGGAVVGGQPDAAGGLGDQVVVGIVGEHGDLRDASGDEGRTDLRARREEKVLSLMGSWSRGRHGRRGRRRRAGGSSCAKAERERHKRSGNNLMDGSITSSTGGGSLANVQPSTSL